VRALVVAGGDTPLPLLRSELNGADIVICADGGAKHVDAAGRMPDVLIGDMDSIERMLYDRLESSGVEIVRANAAKDETDAQLAVDEAIARGATELVLLGALGGRIDHSLGNLMLLVRAAEKDVKAVVKDDACEITAATGHVEIRGRAGDTVSLLPIGQGVSVRYLDGVKYGTKEPLPLPIDAPVGVSNELTADRARVEIIGWAYIISTDKGNMEGIAQ
jgi:thiamine pyrophosphokinase